MRLLRRDVQVAVGAGNSHEDGPSPTKLRHRPVQHESELDADGKWADQVQYLRRIIPFGFCPGRTQTFSLQSVRRGRLRPMPRPSAHRRSVFRPSAVASARAQHFTSIDLSGLSTDAQLAAGSWPTRPFPRCRTDESSGTGPLPLLFLPAPSRVCQFDRQWDGS